MVWEVIPRVPDRRFLTRRGKQTGQMKSLEERGQTKTDHSNICGRDSSVIVNRSRRGTVLVPPTARIKSKTKNWILRGNKEPPRPPAVGAEPLLLSPFFPRTLPSICFTGSGGSTWVSAPHVLPLMRMAMLWPGGFLTRSHGDRGSS